jgi:hypothetical protein
MSKPKKQDNDKGKQLIRNSTAEFLIFTGQSGEQSIEARYEDETIWLSQKLMAQLFDRNYLNYQSVKSETDLLMDVPLFTMVQKYQDKKLGIGLLLCG